VRNPLLPGSLLLGVQLNTHETVPGQGMKTVARYIQVGFVLYFGASLVSCQLGSAAPTPSAAVTPTATSSPQPTPSPVRPAVPPTNLQIAGALSAKDDPALGENACDFGQTLPGKIHLATPQMLLSDGQAIGAEIFLSPAPGTYPAASVASDGRAIVRAHRHTRPAGGGDSGDWFAISGVVVVTAAQNVGDRTNYGIVSGTIDARLSLTGGKQQITLRGTWGCVIDPVANGS
jgi:hypothetical protein